MNILITGGAGFIGVNAAARFLNGGHSVTVLDNFCRKGTEINEAFLTENFPACRMVRGDVRTDRDLLQTLCDEHDAVLHLAAQVAVTTSVHHPLEDFYSNALGTMHVLEAIRAAKHPPILLFASTNKVYGSLEFRKVTEDTTRYRFADDIVGVREDEPLDFHSPYGCSKGAADQYVHDYSRIYGLRTVVFRQSCIYGPHQLGVEDQGWVAWFLIAAMFGKPITVYGNGKQVRDLLHVDDLLAAYELALSKIDVMSGQVVNMGGGMSNALSLLEFFSMLEKSLGKKVALQFTDWRPGDQPIFVSDNSKMQQLTGWSPKVNVHDGIPALGKWLQEHKNLLEKFYS